MILGDSIRQTASIARCVSVDVTATHHTTFAFVAQANRAASEMRREYTAYSTQFL
jgi:hypothetical protein